MPKKSIDYKKSLIYKLIYNNIPYYIGSTTDFIRRKYHHKNCCNNESNAGYNRDIYKFIRDNEGWDNWGMILIEFFPCNSSIELRSREQHWIDEFKPSLKNMAYAKRSLQEYRDSRLEETKIYNTKYSLENKTKRLEKNKIKATCECGSIYRKKDIKHFKTIKHLKYCEEARNKCSK